ncbi:MAG: UPF0158 family protein [Thermodesulfovibrionales bacterium]
MIKYRVDFDEIQKAMEDIGREAFDYFIDTETGDVIILSEDILQKAQAIISESCDEDMSDYEAIEFDEEVELPEWAEDEVELALDIFIDHETRYMRIPERRSDDVFQAMQGFTAALENQELRLLLEEIVDGKGAFRRFKDILEDYPKEKKQWYGYSAKMARKEIAEWLQSVGIKAG